MMHNSSGDSPRTATPEGNASSSVSGGSEGHQSSTSSDSSTEETASGAEGVEEVGCSAPVTSAAAEVVVFKGWESKVLSGRLDNLRKAPKTLPVSFKFREVLHHEVADGAAMVKGYKKLEEMVRRFHIPRTILIRAGTPNERACLVSRTGWVLVYVDHFDADLCFPLPGLIFDVLAEYELTLSQLTPNSIKFIIGFMLLCERLGMPAKAVVFRSLFLCRLCPSTSGTRWYYISGKEKMMIFTNIRNKVARWKRQFVFVRDTRTDRINNELTARLSEWRTPNTYMNYPQMTSGDVDLKNRLLDYVKARGLVDLETLVTPEQIAVHGFVDVANLHSQGEMSSILERQHQRAQGSRNRGAGSGSQRQSRFDERPPAAPGRISQHWGSNSAHRPRVEQRPEPTSLSARRRVREDFDAEDDVPLTRRRTSAGSQPASAVAARPGNVPPAPARENFVPLADRLRVKGHIQQHGGHAALIKLMDAFNYTVALFECEQGARVRNNELQTSCKQLATEKASLADEVSRLQSSKMADRAASVESRADELARKVDELKDELVRARVEKESGIQAAKEELGRVEERAKKAESNREKTLHELSSLRERVDAVAVASANTTTDIFNEEINEEGKSLAPPADTWVRLRWKLNEEGLPVWPPSVIEEGEDTEGLPSFDAWVANPHDVSAEPSSTPPAQPQPCPLRPLFLLLLQIGHLLLSLRQSLTTHPSPST
ncbi:hypothetical protein SLEP1_g48493 [Rubroshorea leprosula]|uniref:Transposase (putative) gypsy type domain-containing protein n=1 Tax=Rubroshorea leprosula TaxID=152421 RepID=A0AAV5LTS9_9ROSI|nr:hypothetical protein SLEP1_g48493 [Rubroshorea leprosula]